MKAIFIVIFYFLIIGCNSNKEKPIVPVFKSIPNNLVNNEDKEVQKINDIVFYKNKKFSGTLYSLYNNIDTAFIESYYNGLEEGITKKWFANKQIAELRYYSNGKKVGTHQAWYENGNKKFEFQINNDEYYGEFKEWNNSGGLIKLFHYKNGQEEGSQKLFYDNGSIRSNYIIKNGRRYGLLGTKNCENVKDSVITN